jgi:hypothetical protein
MDIEAIGLAQLLKSQWNSSPAPADEIASAMDRYRRVEAGLRRWLPEWIVRRFDGGFARSNTVHPETAQALYSICRAVRPRWVFETGTYWGYSTAYLAAALAANQEGRLCTFDIYPKAGNHVPPGLRHWIEFYRGVSATTAMPPILEKARPDIFFQDSVHDFDGVKAEICTVAPYLTTKAVVLLHDFVADGVRRAAVESLPGWRVLRVDSGDPQQLGIALRMAAADQS